MMKSVKDWITEGESLYSTLVEEFQSVQQQMTELEQTLATKKLEVDQLAQVIARAGFDHPTLDRGRRGAEMTDTTARLADALRPQPDVAVRML